MSKKIKILVGLLVLVVIAEGWFIYATYNIEKRIIPLSLFGFNDLEDNVFAQGTWRSDTNLANPIQASDIICLRNSMLCIEARGEITDHGYLVVDTNLFGIGTWNDREIVTKPDDLTDFTFRYPPDFNEGDHPFSGKGPTRFHV